MKEYNIGIKEGIHRVQVTIQQFEFKGHIYTDVFDDCYGKDILDLDRSPFHNLIDKNNDCNLVFNSDGKTFTATLKDDNGKELEVSGTARDFEKMIVAIEIIDYQERKSK